MTKGYGFSVDDIDMSCPEDLRPYEKARKIELEERDAFNHMEGAYNKSAFEVVMAHFGAGLSGKKSDAKYLNEPFMKLAKSNGELTEEEKQREVDKFFAKEAARRSNWKSRKSTNKEVS